MIELPTFYLGCHKACHVERTDTPLFISVRSLWERRRPVSQLTTQLGLDSGGFTELSKHGRWTITPEEYIAEIRRLQGLGFEFEFIAPQDWMCEPEMLDKTGLMVRDHIERTVDNFITLRELAPDLPIMPVLQGWELNDYLDCFIEYRKRGVCLSWFKRVGIGSVCRRQAVTEMRDVFDIVHELGCLTHGFGIKKTGLMLYADKLDSVDSFAWSFNARRNKRHCSIHQGSKTVSCSNCLNYGLEYRDRIMSDVAGQWIGVAA